MHKIFNSYVLIAVSLLSAAVINFVVWPGFDGAILYAIALGVASWSASSRGVITAAGGAMGLDLLSLSHVHEPLWLWSLRALSLGLIGFLAHRTTLGRHAHERRAREAEAAHRQLREFLGEVVHELRNPLTVAVAYIQLARRRLERADQDATLVTLGRVEIALQRMGRLVSDLLDSTRIWGARFVIKLTAMDLSHLVRQVIAELEGISDGHHFVVDVPAHLTGEWDAERLRQVLTNLITNAVKYSADGTAVRVTARADDATALLSIADQGDGIDQTRMAQMFHPFARLDHGGQATGTGLGLHITKGIVDAHYGRIWVESSLGRGSTFFVELPRHPTITEQLAA